MFNHVPAGHMYVCSGKMTILILFPIFPQQVVISDVECRSSLYILDINPLSKWINGSQIFSPFPYVAFFILLIISFAVQKVFGLMWAYLSISAFVGCVFGAI